MSHPPRGRNLSPAAAERPAKMRKAERGSHIAMSLRPQDIHGAVSALMSRNNNVISKVSKDTSENCDLTFSLSRSTMNRSTRSGF